MSRSVNGRLDKACFLSHYTIVLPPMEEPVYGKKWICPSVVYIAFSPIDSVCLVSKDLTLNSWHCVYA